MRSTKRKLMSFLLAAGVMAGQFGLNVLPAMAETTITSVTVTVADDGKSATVGGTGYSVNYVDSNDGVSCHMDLRADDGYVFGPEGGTYSGTYTINNLTVTNVDLARAFILSFEGTLGGSSSNAPATPDTPSTGSGETSGTPANSSAQAGGTTAGKSATGPVAPPVPQYTEAQLAYMANHDHAHNGNFGSFEWKTVTDASDFSDGKEEFRCPDCGYVLYSIPVSGFAAFNRNLVTRIQKAPANSTVTIEAGQWISFHKMVYDAMNARKDLTYVINYRHQGVAYAQTIPAGTDLSNVVAEGQNCAGFLSLPAIVGVPAEAK